MPLGTKVGLSPGDSVLDEYPDPSPQRGWSLLPNFRPISIVAKRLDASRCHQGLWVGWGPSLPSQKGGRGRGKSPQFSAHGYCGRTAGWIKMYGTWHGGRSWSSPHCARWGHSSPPQNREQSPSKFSVHLYCDQTAGCIKMPLNWYGGRLGICDIVFDVDPATPEKGHSHSTQFLAHVYCGQMAGWMKTPLGTEVDLGPGHIVLHGVPAPAKGAQQPFPLFGPCLLWPRSPIPATDELFLFI